MQQSVSFKTPLLGVPLQSQPNSNTKNLDMTAELPVLPAMEARKDMVHLKNYKASNSVENFLEDLVNMTHNSKFEANEFDTRSCYEYSCIITKYKRKKK